MREKEGAARAFVREGKLGPRERERGERRARAREAS